MRNAFSCPLRESKTTTVDGNGGVRIRHDNTKIANAFLRARHGFEKSLVGMFRESRGAMGGERKAGVTHLSAVAD